MAVVDEVVTTVDVVVAGCDVVIVVDVAVVVSVFCVVVVDVVVADLPQDTRTDDRANKQADTSHSIFRLFNWHSPPIFLKNIPYFLYSSITMSIGIKSEFVKHILSSSCLCPIINPRRAMPN
ncbi:MAG: hypothetical protein NTX46_00320 [Chloroflexi bacterium]|nr:hypothetical protein [Chloroflexota bacterium]